MSRRSALQINAPDWLIALVIAGPAFWVIVGPGVLNVGNILWLTTVSDTFTHYLGWEFFRRGPWTWPPGLNPDYGLEYSSSVIFSDSVPLIAIPMKALAPILPEVFQFTGWWTLLCFVLQAYFAVRLAGIIAPSRLLKVGVATLMVFSPPLLWRLSAHFSLITHWIVLAALFLYWAPPIRSNLRWLAWATVLCAGTLTHEYLFAMCLPLWVASIVRRRKIDGSLSPPWFIEVPLVLAAAAATLWLGGFFPLRPSYLSGGYGIHHLNLLSIFNPNGAPGADQWSWSMFLPMLGQGPGDYEGFNYLGLGGILAFVVALPLVWLQRALIPKVGLRPLLVALLVLLLFAITPKVGIGGSELTIPVPNIVYLVGNVMRASGRFFWPIWYLIILGSAWLITTRVGARATGVVFLLLAAIQVYDTSPGWGAYRPKFDLKGSEWTTSLSGIELARIAAHYRSVRALPAANASHGWDQIAYFAVRNHMSTDVTYLARANDRAYEITRILGDSVIQKHALDTDSIYFLDKSFAEKVLPTMSSDDEMFRVSDFYVFAPRWHSFGIDVDLPTVGDH